MLTLQYIKPVMGEVAVRKAHLWSLSYIENLQSLVCMSIVSRETGTRTPCSAGPTLPPKEPDGRRMGRQVSVVAVRLAGCTIAGLAPCGCGERHSAG